ncbi:MAG: hypothetical protein ABEK59_12460, partial [Halobacteria archaeon]
VGITSISGCISRQKGSAEANQQDLVKPVDTSFDYRDKDERADVLVTLLEMPYEKRKKYWRKLKENQKHALQSHAMQAELVHENIQTNMDYKKGTKDVEKMVYTSKESEPHFHTHETDNLDTSDENIKYPPGFCGSGTFDGVKCTQHICHVNVKGTKYTAFALNHACQWDYNGQDVVRTNSKVEGTSNCYSPVVGWNWKSLQRDQWTGVGSSTALNNVKGAFNRCGGCVQPCTTEYAISIVEVKGDGNANVVSQRCDSG